MRISCFKGLTERSVAAGNNRQGGGGGGGGPDFSATAEALSESTGREFTAKDIASEIGNAGPPGCDDIINAATTIGVTVEQLIEAGLPLPPGLACEFF